MIEVTFSEVQFTKEDVVKVCKMLPAGDIDEATLARIYMKSLDPAVHDSFRQLHELAVELGAIKRIDTHPVIYNKLLPLIDKFEEAAQACVESMDDSEFIHTLSEQLRFTTAGKYVHTYWRVDQEKVAELQQQVNLVDQLNKDRIAAYRTYLADCEKADQSQ